MIKKTAKKPKKTPKEVIPEEPVKVKIDEDGLPIGNVPENWKE